MKPRTPLHAYRLVSRDSPHTSELLWEWEQPFIDRLLWTAKTFGRHMVQRYFADWHALAEENRRIWDAYYRLRPADDPSVMWQAWIAEYRTLVATTQEVCELQYGHKRTDQRPTLSGAPDVGSTCTSLACAPSPTCLSCSDLSYERYRYQESTAGFRASCSSKNSLLCLRIATHGHTLLARNT